MAARDRRNPNFAGGDLTLSEVSERLAAMGHSVTYVCSSLPGLKHEDVVFGVRVLRFGSLWTASLRTFFYYIKNRGKFRVVLQEALGGLRIPYFSPLYVRKPLVAVWYQRNDRIFRYQYNRIVAAFLDILEYAVAKVHRNRLVLCPSKRSLSDLEELGFDRRLIRTYTPGIDESVLARSSQALQSRREDMLVWIGKIRKFKCPHHAIMALDRVRKSVPDCMLIIAGYPEDRRYLNHLKEISSKLQLNNALIFRFRISEEEKGMLLLKSKVLLITSPVEGFANVASEANACGTPVVATYGIPSDVVTNDVNGFRVPFGDVEAMATACNRILLDSNTFDRLSKRGIELAKGRDWNQTTSTFLGVMEEASMNSQNRADNA
jgi:glycosyltransferase involved in cell wall biosynthesis